ncbi:MAG: glycosyltransferase family A protein [Acidobacteriota bacterium]
MTRIHLVLLGPGGDVESHGEPWPHGEWVPVTESQAGVEALAEALDALMSRAGTEDAVLCWDTRLGPPPEPAPILARPGDVWHGGLLLGQEGRPFTIDYVHPTWMLNRDPDPHLEATSWRLSLRACLTSVGVWRRFGGIDPAFDTLDGASLELGHRWLMAGAVPRHVPSLLPEGSTPRAYGVPTVADTLRFVRRRSGPRWTLWAAARGVRTGHLGIFEAFTALRRIRRELPVRGLEDTVPSSAPSPRPASDSATTREAPPRVTVLVPTLDRYPYLEVLLEQLGEQTVPPLEILVIDQTEAEQRRRDWPERFPNLPIRYVELDVAGQCSSRNLGLAQSRGDAVLFLDDDDEVPADLLERHLASLEAAGAQVSCGVADEVGGGPLPEAFRRRRASDVFPTNNGMVRRDALEASGLFDLAFERGARADADLGMRLYLSGALSILDPTIRVLHHHAPRGGLRRHDARVVTYAASRRWLTARRVPEATEIYLARRYFSPRQAREMLVIAVAGTFSIRGGALRRLAKAAYALLTLPLTLRTLGQRRRKAEAMLEEYPRIPSLAQGTEASVQTGVR